MSSYLCLRNVSVDFPIYHGSSRSLKKTLLATSTRGNLARDGLDRISVRALNDITFDLASGDRLALIGPNGAGKTTLLKLLAGIFEPTQGKFYSSGSVASLLDTQLGLQSDATGHENIILRGMFMGIRPRAMRRLAPEIAEFTGLGDYLDMPVRTYSSGMMVRLGFAISTCIRPEILIMDEWLTVGDAQFLEKAQHRINSFVEASSILVLASHSLEMVEKWCNRGILLHQGRVAAAGSVKDITAAYRRLIEPSADPSLVTPAAAE